MKNDLEYMWDTCAILLFIFNTLQSTIYATALYARHAIVENGRSPKAIRRLTFKIFTLPIRISISRLISDSSSARMIKCVYVCWQFEVAWFRPHSPSIDRMESNWSMQFHFEWHSTLRIRLEVNDLNDVQMQKCIGIWRTFFFCCKWNLVASQRTIYSVRK